jgi:hypothetical protein
MKTNNKMIKVIKMDSNANPLPIKSETTKYTTKITRENARNPMTKTSPPRIGPKVKRTTNRLTNDSPTDGLLSNEIDRHVPDRQELPSKEKYESG